MRLELLIVIYVVFMAFNVLTYNFSFTDGLSQQNIPV